MNHVIDFNGIVFIIKVSHRCGDTWEMSFSQEQISEWKKDGWTFRVKTSKGKQYITRRRGQEERGMGRYNDKLWNIIKDTDREYDLHKQQQTEKENAINEIEYRIKLNRAFEMGRSCSHSIDGFCHFWRHNFKPFFSQLLMK